MKKQKVLPIILTIAMMLTAAFPLGIAAMGSNPTELDISAGSITITENGASGGGMEEAETELNPDGYVITGRSETNTIEVRANVDVSIELDNVSIILESVTSGTTPFKIESGAAVALELKGDNVLSVNGSSSVYAGIGLVGNAELSINGSGSLTVFGKSSGIGAQSGNALSGKIEINGGIIHASAANGAGIGGVSGRSAGQIIINGGTITAVSERGNAGIGHGRAPGVDAPANASPVIINGGSVNSTVQTTPLNEFGDELRLVTAAIDGGENKKFTLTSADGGENTAMTDADGKLYLYIPKTAIFVSVSDGRNMYYADGIEEDVNVEVDMIQFAGGNCTCTDGSGEIVFEGKNIEVNAIIGSATFTLEPSFKPADDCKYPAHNLSDAEYRLAADVPNTEATVNGRELTVYAAAGNKDIEVTVTALVNEKEYSKTAVFHITLDDSYAMDLSDGNIIISESQITVGDKIYSIEDQSKAIRIFQSGNADNRTIRIESTVKNREVILDNLNMQQTGRTSTDSRITVLRDAILKFTLVGDNSAVMYPSVNAPAIWSAGGSTITFSGSGSLYAKGGDANVAIGANRTSAMGTVIVESGRITAVGGNETLKESGDSNHDAAPAIGAPIGGVSGGTFTIKGGVVSASGAPRSDRGDINTSVVIDGGSLISPVEISGTVRDSNGSPVYLTETTLEGVSGAHDIVYYVTVGEGSEGSAISSALDENGKLYMYLPDDNTYRRIRAQLADDPDTDYYKRIKVSGNENEDKYELIKNPTGAITTFYIVGQSNCVINEETKIITISVPSLSDLTNSTPTVQCGGLEYKPSGAVNFQDNPEQIFSVILDNGETVNYTVKIERTDSSDDEMSVLDIGAGDILMFEDGDIHIGDVVVADNPNGYIITGNSNKNYLYIGDITAPIVFKNLTIDTPERNEEENKLAPIVVAGADVKISIDGTNVMNGDVGSSAMYIFGEASASISGNGILTLRGGSSAQGVMSEDNTAKLVINDANVFIIDGEGAAASGGTIPENADGEKLYPLIITIDDEDAANSKMIYSDTRYNADGEIVSTIQKIEMISDSASRISVYKPVGSYLVNVLWNGEAYYSEEPVAVSSNNTPAKPATVTLTIPGITGLSFVDPKTSFAAQVAVILSGTNLGGDMVVIATGENGETVSANAVKRGDIWEAVLSIPANEDMTGMYRWVLSARIGDEEQELSEAVYLDMWTKLAITSFSIDEGKQVGEAQIDHSARLVTIVVPYDVDLESTNFRPNMTYTGDSVFASWQTSLTSWQGDLLNLSNPAQVELSYDSGKMDYVRYSIRALTQAVPAVLGISFEQPADYNGGDVVITLTGENFENLANAYASSAKQIVVSAAGVSRSVSAPVTDENGNQVWRVTLPIPDNISGVQTVRHPITITINGVSQTFTGEHEIIVPARIEALANITGFAFNDAEGNPIEAVSLEITDGTAGSVSGGTSGTPGKIAIVLPSGTNLAETALIPSVTLENPKANLRIIDAEGNEYGAGDTIIFTETNVPVTLTVVSEDGENTMSYELEVTVQTRRKSSGKSKDESVTPGSVTFEAYAGGYEDNTFRPDNVITRAEAAALLARLDDRFDETVPYAAYDKNFWDVASGSWYAKYVGYLAGEGVITGYEDGSFCPNNQISRMEFAALLSRFAESTGIDLKDIEKELAGGNDGAGSTSDTANAASSAVNNIALNALTASAAVLDTASLDSAALVSEPAVPLSDISGLWGEEHILGLADAGVVNGYEDGTFRPDGQTTRAETVTMLNRMLGRTMTDELRAAINNAANPFSDLSSEHWAYCDIMAAVHDYTVKTSVIGKNITVKVELK